MNFTGSTFENQDVLIDGHSYTNCKFNNCNIVYAGEKPFTLDGCGIRDDCRFVLTGPAQQGLRFLDLIYHGFGAHGRKIVEETFKDIKRGKYTQAAPGPSLN